MARGRKKKGSGRSKLVIDGTAIKLGAMLFRQYNGPAAIQRVQNKDFAGALDAYGQGTILNVVSNSVIAGAGYKVKEKFTRGVPVIRGKRFIGKF